MEKVCRWESEQVGATQTKNYIKPTFSLSHQLTCKGLTLIELLIVIAVMGIVSLGLYYVLRAGMTSWETGEKRTDIIQHARLAMDRLSREVREARYIASADAGSINFSAYLGKDASENPYDITYSYHGSALYRTADAGSEKMLAMNVTDFNLTYYSKYEDDGSIHVLDPGFDPLDIWMISIESKVIEGDNEVNLRSTIQPRNYPYPQ